MNKISDQKLQEKVKFHPLPWQEDIIDCNAKEVLICCGRRSGKSVLVSYLGLKKLLEPNQIVWIVAPNYLLTEIVFNNILGFVAQLFDSKEYKVVNKPYKTLTLQNGSKLECKSVEAKDGMLGHSTDFIIMDEAARISADIWTQYLKPTTQDRKARVVFISTPTGMNWFYDKYLELKKKKAAFNYPSKVNTTIYDDAKWQELKETETQKTFEQEYEAKFISDAGVVFRGVDDVVDDYNEIPPEEGKGYILGVDIAKHEDYTVLMVMDRTTCKVVYIDRFKQIDYNLQKERIITLSRKYNNAKVIIDSSGIGDPVTDDLKQHAFVEGYSMHSGKAKAQLIDKLSIYIEQKLITIPNDEDLIDELKRYGYTKTESGIDKYSAPEHRHDDMIIALALCVWGILGPQKEENKEPERFILHNDYI